MTSQTQAQPQAKKGCSVIAVVILSIFALVLGLLGGAGGFYYFLKSSPDTAADLGIATAPAAEAQPTTTETPEASPKAPSTKPDYALLYPIEESLRIEGPVDPKTVTTKVKDNRYELRSCYQKGLTKNPDLKGEMSVQFTISGSNGKVIAAVERHTNFPSADVRDCILGELKDWNFEGGDDALSVVKFDILMIPISSAAAEK